MVENRNQQFTFTIKQDVYDHAVKLADECNIGNVKVFMTKKIMKYVSRMSKDRVHALTPIPRKLNSSTKTNVQVTLMLTDDELAKARSLMKYHWFYTQETDKYQCSQFMACLIEHEWLKYHPEQTLSHPEENKPRPKVRINLDDWGGNHDGEDWSGEG